MELLILGYPERLVTDHEALVKAAEAAGFIAELVAPSRVGLLIDAGGEQVVVDGRPRHPQVVLPRGVNRPWPILRQILQVWEQSGVLVVPSVAAADRCADKLATTRVLAAAGVPVLPTLGVVPGPGVALQALAIAGPVVTKPARASKARGVQSFRQPSEAQTALREGRPLVDDMVDHHVVQPLASEAGCDYRVVVAGHRVVAVTERLAPVHDFVTNRPGAQVRDVDDPERVLPEVVEVAQAATRALDLAFGGVDVIRHEGRAVVLEVNAWPGLAAHVRYDQLAISLLEAVRALPPAHDHR